MWEPHYGNHYFSPLVHAWDLLYKRPEKIELELVITIKSAAFLSNFWLQCEQNSASSWKEECANGDFQTPLCMSRILLTA